MTAAAWDCDLFDHFKFQQITSPMSVSPSGVFVATDTFASGRSSFKTLLSPLSASLHQLRLHRRTRFEQVPSEPLCSTKHTHTLTQIPSSSSTFSFYHCNLTPTSSFPLRSYCNRDWAHWFWISTHNWIKGVNGDPLGAAW